MTEAEGAVGVLVNNAGYSQSGAVETVPLDQVRRQFETNVFGLIRMCQLVLPGMREQRWGKIVNIGSMGGRLTFPGGGLYHATKYAVEAISDALRFEVRGFGVDVILIEPGLIVTGVRRGRDGDRGPPDDDGPYARFNRRWRRSTTEAYKGPMAKLGGGPETVAKTIAERARGGRPKARYPVTPERAPDDQPAAVHPGPGLGPDDARAVPDAEAARHRPASALSLERRRAQLDGVARDRVGLAELATPNGPVATARHRTPSAARRRCPAACRRSRSSRSRVWHAPRSRARGGRSRAAPRGPRSPSRTRPGRRRR